MLRWTPKIASALLSPEFADSPDKPCRLIVETASPFMNKVATLIESNEGKIYREMKIIPSMVAEVPYSALAAMARSPHVKKIWHDTKVRTLLDIAVPTAGGSKGHGTGVTGKDVTVAVIDTGIFPHPDLMYPRSRIVAWKDLVNEWPLPYDDNGHGTHVCGIIAGNGASSRGKYMGMAPEANLIGIKALDQNGTGNTSDVISGLEWCIENQKNYNIKVINLSIGAAAQDSAWGDPLCRAVDAAWRKGMVVCTAAGNDGPDPRTINTPGITPNAITVGNLDDKRTDDFGDDTINDSSSRGPTIDNLIKPDLLAPGTGIISLRVGGGYRSLTGTSMATAMTSGAAAQILQQWPSLWPSQVKMILMRNARTMGLQSIYGGSGALNVERLFDVPQKHGADRLKSVFTMIFNEGPIFGTLFGAKPSIG